MKHVPRQRGLWTATRGVSTAIFRDKLRGIQSKKRNGGHVDLSFPYNIKSDDCPQDPGGGPGPKHPFSRLICIAPLAHWGEPFHCPRPGVLYSSVGLAFHRLHEEGCGRQRSKRIKEGQGQTRGNSTLAGSSKRLLAECNTDTATL